LIGDNYEAHSENARIQTQETSMPRKKKNLSTAFAFDFAKTKSAMAALQDAAPTHFDPRRLPPLVIEAITPVMSQGYADEQIIAMLEQHQAGSSEALTVLVQAVRRAFEAAEAEAEAARSDDGYDGLKSAGPMSTGAMEPKEMRADGRKAGKSGRMSKTSMLASEAPAPGDPAVVMSPPALTETPPANTSISVKDSVDMADQDATLHPAPTESKSKAAASVPATIGAHSSENPKLPEQAALQHASAASVASKAVAAPTNSAPPKTSLAAALRNFSTVNPTNAGPTVPSNERTAERQNIGQGIGQQQKLDV
jgi:hypothetical protein